MFNTRSLHMLNCWWAAVRLAQVALQRSGDAHDFILNTYSLTLCKVLSVGKSAKSQRQGEYNETAKQGASTG